MPPTGYPVPPPTAYMPGYPPPYPAHNPSYGQHYPPPYGQPSYLQPAYGYPRDHPKAGLALGLALGGILGGFFTLGLGFVLGPFAWVIGQKARTEIKQSNGMYHAEGNATAGMVLGIVCTVFLALAILFWVAIILIGTSANSSGGTNALGTLLTARS